MWDREIEVIETEKTVEKNSSIERMLEAGLVAEVISTVKLNKARCRTCGATLMVLELLSKCQYEPA